MLKWHVVIFYPLLLYKNTVYGLNRSFFVWKIGFFYPYATNNMIFAWKKWHVAIFYTHVLA